MRTSFLTIATLVAAVSASAVTFTPSPADLGDLDHHQATTWGINWSLPAGQQVTGATLTIKNIYDWQQEYDQLYIHLLDNPAKGVVSITDNTADNVFQDYFSGQGRYLTTFSDPYGGAPRNFDFVYNFTANDLTALKTYLGTAPGTAANFGFGFDPDCHYYNDGVTFEIRTTYVPETGSSLVLLSIGLLALAAIRSKTAPALVLAKARC